VFRYCFEPVEAAQDALCCLCLGHLDRNVFPVVITILAVFAAKDSPLSLVQIVIGQHTVMPLQVSSPHAFGRTSHWRSQGTISTRFFELHNTTTVRQPPAHAHSSCQLLMLPASAVRTGRQQPFMGCSAIISLSTCAGCVGSRARPPCRQTVARGGRREEAVEVAVGGECTREGAAAGASTAAAGKVVGAVNGSDGSHEESRNDAERGMSNAADALLCGAGATNCGVAASLSDADGALLASLAAEHLAESICHHCLLFVQVQLMLSMKDVDPHPGARLCVLGRKTRYLANERTHPFI
jgi:hypothetical protein